MRLRDLDDILVASNKNFDTTCGGFKEDLGQAVVTKVERTLSWLT